VLQDPVRRTFERYGLTWEIGSRHFLPTVEVAVDAFRRPTGVHPTSPAASGTVLSGRMRDRRTARRTSSG